MRSWNAPSLVRPERFMEEQSSEARAPSVYASDAKEEDHLSMSPVSTSNGPRMGSAKVSEYSERNEDVDEQKGEET